MGIVNRVRKVFCRYRASGTDYFEDEIENLKLKKIFLSKPSLLNDPFDCSPGISETPIQEISKEIRKFGLEKFRRTRMRKARDSGMYTGAELRSLRENYSNSLSAAKFEAPLVKNNMAFHNERSLRVACFSETKRSVLMWGHYAESHKGFVVKYHLDLNDISGKNTALPLQVEYSDVRPVFSTLELMKNWALSEPSKERDDNARIQKGYFLTKSDAWREEKEWRVVENVNGTDGYFEFKNLKPSAIFAGANMSEDKVSFIQRTLPEMPVFKARLGKTSYDLESDEL
ncbi:DUF2971 domain-containing protein [Tateyamaria sp.]|uniref:DUF2971 domain-containing protein n=1 Tax=Tateyamaria sp. TaxID=1929288 RepID=UPI00329F1232